MSPETDRIPVPTNGKGPHPVEERAPAAEAPPPAQAPVAFTPMQLAVGFAILASLAALLVKRTRGRGRQRRGPFGRR